MKNSHATDYVACGLPSGHGINAFTSCAPKSTRIDAFKPPKKTGPRMTKAQEAAISIETPAERKARHLLKKNKNTRVDEPCQADKDKTNSIIGKSFHGREM